MLQVVCRQCLTAPHPGLPVSTGTLLKSHVPSEPTPVAIDGGTAQPFQPLCPDVGPGHLDWQLYRDYVGCEGGSLV